MEVENREFERDVDVPRNDEEMRDVEELFNENIDHTNEVTLLIF